MKKHHLSMIFVNVMWGLSVVASKHAKNSGFTPLVLACARYAIASACLVPFLLKSEGKMTLRRKDILPMVMSGFVGITAYYYFEYHGISRTSAVDASLILAAIPILTMVAEAVLYRTKMRSMQVLGSLASLGGVALIVAGSAQEQATLVGNLFILGAAVVWVAYIFLSRRLREDYSSLAMNTWQALSALLTLLPLTLTEACDISAIPWDGWAAAALLAVICSALCYYMYGNSLSAMSPLASAIYINLIPLTTIISGVLFLGETLTWVNALGGLLIIISIAMVNLSDIRKGGQSA